jgi:hypothetical protein
MFFSPTGHHAIFYPCLFEPALAVLSTKIAGFWKITESPTRHQRPNTAEQLRKITRWSNFRSH